MSFLFSRRLHFKAAPELRGLSDCPPLPANDSSKFVFEPRLISFFSRAERISQNMTK